MNPMLLGAASGLGLAVGVIVVVRAWEARRPTLLARLAPYVERRPSTSGLLRGPDPGDGRTVTALVLSLAGSLGGLLEATGSSADSVRRRLQRLGGRPTYEDLRLEQMLWSGIAVAVTAALGLVLLIARGASVPLLLLACLISAVAGASARDWWLSRAVTLREARIEAQLPDVVELLALAVSAGQGPVAGLERIVAIGRGDLVDELSVTLGEVRSGTILTTALLHLEERVGSLHVTRLCEAIAVALERGTPLAEVLRAQAADAREASRRALMEEGGKREIAQMVPVVFLVLPITVVFAMFPGLTVLRVGL